MNTDRVMAGIGLGVMAYALFSVHDATNKYLVASLPVWQVLFFRSVTIVVVCLVVGRRNWLFAWTELGAKHVGIVQSLIVTCRLHDINPYDYFVDVLQRVGQHPASKVHELTPRLWKQLFADKPLRSDLYQATTGELDKASK